MNKVLPIPRYFPSDNFIIDAHKNKDIKIGYKNVIIKSSKIGVKKSEFSFCNFSKGELNNITFTRCVFEKCDFTSMEIRKCVFNHCKFIDCTFYKTEFDDVYLDPKTLYFSNGWRKYWPNVNVGLYQSLYKDLRRNYQDDFARVADKNFHFYKRYQGISGGNKRYLEFLISVLYDIFMGCGYGVWNCIFVAIIVTSSYACLMKSLLHGDNYEDSFLHQLYYAVVTISTVGYGDYSSVKNGFFPIALTIAFIIFSFAWGAITTAIIVKRVVK